MRDHPVFLGMNVVRPANGEPALGQLEIVRNDRFGPFGVHVDGCRAVDGRSDAFHRYPETAETGHRPAAQAEIQQILDIGRIQDRDLGMNHGQFTVVRRRGRLGQMVVTEQGQHPAMRRRTGRIGMPERITRPVDSWTLAVPDTEHAVVLRVGHQSDLLRAPDGGGSQVFVQTGIEMNAAPLEELPRIPQRLVVDAERGATVSRDVPAGVEPGFLIEPALHQGQPY